ncbi:MAG: hypothetical protein WBC51_12735 [Vicinamibacterales bacterium]
MASAVRATVLLPAEFREIVGDSQIIAYGRVVDAVSELSDDRKRIETIVTFEVETYLKGGPGETLTFRVPGGQVGRYRSITVGAPVLEAGNEAVLFLRKPERGLPYVFGLNQGVFRVQRDTRTQRRLVAAPLLARGETPESVVRGAASRQPMPLETFGAQVRSVMAELAEGRR